MHYKAQRNIGRERAVDREVRKLELQRNRFSVLSTMDGFEVIDYDGRPVAGCTMPQEAGEIVGRLNAAAREGYLEGVLASL